MKNTIFTVIAAIVGAGFGAGIIHQSMKEQLNDMSLELKAVKNAQAQIHHHALDNRSRLTNLEVKSKRAYNPYDPFGVMKFWGL